MNRQDPGSTEPKKISDDVVEAVRLAQQQALRETSDPRVRRLELAMDYLLEHPLATGDSSVMLAEALCQARTKLRRRAAIRSFTSPPLGMDQKIGQVESDALVIEFVDVVRRAPMSSRDRALLAFATADVDPTVILSISPQRAREQLSRARAHARRCIAERVAS